MRSISRGRGCGVRRSKVLSASSKTIIENLEGRRLLSVAYDYTLLAQTGTGGITAISPDVSVNDANAVAFQGSTSKDNGIFVGDGTAQLPIHEINPGQGVGGNQFSPFVQIRDNAVVAQERLPGPKSFILSYNIKSGSATEVAKAEPGIETDSAVFFPAVNNSGTVVYSALKSNVNDNNNYLESSSASNNEVSLGPGVTQLMEMEDNSGGVVFREGNSTTSPIVKELNGFVKSVIIASISGFSALGQSPGIAGDGNSVAFYGVNSKGPGIFLWNSGTVFEIASIQKDSKGNVTGPVSAFSADSRVAISLTPTANVPGYVVFEGNDTKGKQAIFMEELTFDPNSTNPGHITFAAPVKIAGVGQTVPGLSGSMQTLSIYDPLNAHGGIAYEVTTTTGATAVIRADPVLRPVLIIPGIAGSFASDPADLVDWAIKRGVDPTTLKIDPLAKTYDDTIQTLENQGYILGKDLFAAVYDWRLDPGPTPTGGPTGQVPGLTASNITAGKYTYGVDYLGYWLKQAEDSWESRFHEPLDSVDVICHSTGGLVARSYMQSDAYGGTYSDSTYGNIPLPKINNIVMAGVPNRGAVGPLNPLLDNWNSDPANAFILSKLIYTAYRQLVDGVNITGPTYTITQASIADKNGKPDLAKFVQLYCPCIQDLLGTFPLVNTGAGLKTVADAPTLSFLSNNFLLNLNGGSDPNAFASDANHVFIAYGMGQTTASSVQQRIGAAGTTEFFGNPAVFNAILSMGDIAGGHNAVAGQVWYQDISAPNSGDGTVPLQSSEEEFVGDPRFTIQGFNTTHTGLMSFASTERFFLQSLGIPITGSISTTLAGADASVISGTVTSMIIDPVDAFLVDGQGRKVGFSSSTGALTQIPNSIFYGDSNEGLAFIFGSEPSLSLQLTGKGKPYFAQVEDGGGKTVGGTVQSGTTLATGAKLTFPVTSSSGGGTTTPLPPVANPDTVSVTKNIATAINELTNDTDPNTGGVIDPTTVKIITAPTHGKDVINTTTGVITYTPTTGYTGPDSFTYTVKDKAGLVSNTATVSITVSAVLPPVANPDTVSVTKNIATAINELTNDTDPNTGGAIDPTTVKIVTAPTHGKTAINATTGVITYTPTTGYTGPDSFTYTVKDKAGQLSNTAKVSITVAAPKPPVAAADTVSANKNTAIVINELTNDTDPNAGGAIDPTSVKIVTAVAHGKTTINTTTGAITYTPTSGYTGPDSFTYTVKDKLGLVSNTAKVSITVNPPATDVTSKLKIVVGKATLNSTTKHYSQVVTITNTGTTAVAGPLVLVLDTLSKGATLNNKTGVTTTVAPLGSPYIALNLGTATTLAAGKSVMVTLDFLDPTNAAISFKSRVLSGPGAK
jgi:Bacterial Ig domain